MVVNKNNWEKELEKIWTKNPAKFRDTIKFIEDNFILKEERVINTMIVIAVIVVYIFGVMVCGWGLSC